MMNLGEDAEMLLSGLQHLHIDDSHVNKTRRRRSLRIQQRKEETERRWTLDTTFGVEVNNNMPPIEAPVKKPPKDEFELEHENVHYRKAIQQFTYIRDNEYLVRRSKSKNIDSDCGCKLSLVQIASGKFGCGEGCLNRECSVECDTGCPLGKLCSNQRFQTYENAKCTIFITEKKGYGLFAATDIRTKTFVMEFVGEVVSMSAFKVRSKEYAKQKLRHHYVMTSTGSSLIDATKKGNLTRFINHSCDPNAETQKWTVNGQGRIGIFTVKPLKAFEEITINYQFERFGKDAQKCYCESSNCTGWIGS